MLKTREEGVGRKVEGGASAAWAPLTPVRNSLPTPQPLATGCFADILETFDFPVNPLPTYCHPRKFGKGSRSKFLLGW